MNMLMNLEIEPTPKKEIKQQIIMNKDESKIVEKEKEKEKEKLN